MTYDEFRDAFRDKYNALYNFATTYIDFNEVEDRLESAHAEWEKGTSWIFDPMEFFMVCSNEPKKRTGDNDEKELAECLLYYAGNIRKDALTAWAKRMKRETAESVITTLYSLPSAAVLSLEKDAADRVLQITTDDLMNAWNAVHPDERELCPPAVFEK